MDRVVAKDTQLPNNLATNVGEYKMHMSHVSVFIPFETEHLSDILTSLVLPGHFGSVAIRVV